MLNDYLKYASPTTLASFWLDLGDAPASNEEIAALRAEVWETLVVLVGDDEAKELVDN